MKILKFLINETKTKGTQLRTKEGDYQIFYYL